MPRSNAGKPRAGCARCAPSGSTRRLRSTRGARPKALSAGSESRSSRLLASGAAIGVLLLRKRQLRLRAERARRQEVERALLVAEQRLLRSFTAHPDAMIITELGSNAVLDVMTPAAG